MQVFDTLDQGSDEWIAVRLGLPTASCFKEVMQKPGPRGGVPKGRQTYMAKLAGERLTGEPMTSFISSAMQRGTEREDEARSLYAMLYDVEPAQVGFIKNGNCGCSPDSLIGDDGLLEIKDAAAHIQIERLIADEIPSEHVPQVQGQLMVTGRKWCDFMSHCRGIRPLVIRVERDEDFIAQMRKDIDEFVSELETLVEQVRAI